MQPTAYLCSTAAHGWHRVWGPKKNVPQFTAIYGNFFRLGGPQGSGPQMKGGHASMVHKAGPGSASECKRVQRNRMRIHPVRGVAGDAAGWVVGWGGASCRSRSRPGHCSPPSHEAEHPDCAAAVSPALGHRLVAPPPPPPNMGGLRGQKQVRVPRPPISGLHLSPEERFSTCGSVGAREGTSEAAPEAIRSAVGGGCQSGRGRLLSVTNAVEAGTWRLRDRGWA